MTAFAAAVVLDAPAPVAVPVVLPPLPPLPPLVLDAVAEADAAEDAEEADATAEPFGAALPPATPPVGELFCEALAAAAA